MLPTPFQPTRRPLHQVAACRHRRGPRGYSVHAPGRAAGPGTALAPVLYAAAFVLAFAVPHRQSAARAEEEPAQGAVAARPGAEKPARTDRLGDPLPPDALVRIGTARLRHPGETTWAVFVPGSNLLASGGVDGMIRLWEVPGGREVRRWKAGRWDFSSYLTAAPDGRLLASTGHDGVVHVWETATGKERLALADLGKGTATCLAFSPRGDILAVGGHDTTVGLWEVATGRLVRRLRGQGIGGPSLAFAPDGRTVARGAGDGTIRLWEVASGKEIGRLDGHYFAVTVSATTNRTTGPTSPPPRGRPAEILSLAFAPDGKTLASAAQDSSVLVWDLATGRKLRRLRGRCAAFTPNGKLLIGSGDGALHFWDAATGRELRQLRLEGPVRALSFSADGKVLVTAGSGVEIQLWKIPEGREIGLHGRLPGGIRTLSVAPDGKAVAGSWYDQIWIWDAADGDERHELQQEWVLFPALSWTPDGRALAVGGSVMPSVPGPNVWDVATWQRVALSGLRGGISAAAFSPAGRVVAVRIRQEPVIHLCDTATGKELRAIRTPGSRFASLVFTPDGKLLAWSAGDCIGLTDVATGRLLRRIERPEFFRIEKLAFSPDSRILAARTLDTIVLWETPSGRERRRWGIRGNYRLALEFSPNGRMLATGGPEGTVRLVELATGEERRHLLGHQGVITALAFFPDGRRLISASTDGTALIWDIRGGAASPGTARLTPRLLDDLWTALADASPPDAYRAVCTLAHAPGQAVPFLKQHLRPVEPVAAGRIAQLIRDLDSNTFAVRQQAQAELEKLAELAEPALQAALDARPALEVRQRIGQLLAKRHGARPSPSHLRALRAVEALEAMHTADAENLLRTLAQGAVGAELTAEAQAALKRLEPRPPTRAAEPQQPGADRQRLGLLLRPPGRT